jgi:hypothetical protein
MAAPPELTVQRQLDSLRKRLEEARQATLTRLGADAKTAARLDHQRRDELAKILPPGDPLLLAYDRRILGDEQLEIFARWASGVSGVSSAPPSTGGPAPPPPAPPSVAAATDAAPAAKRSRSKHQPRPAAAKPKTKKTAKKDAG